MTFADGCGTDPIRDRDLETAGSLDLAGAASRAWRIDAATLTARSAFYRRKYRAAGVDPASVEDVEGLAALPFTDRAELRAATEERPPFGDNLGVALDEVKRVYLTSGTSGAPAVVALTAADARAWTAVGARTYHATGIHSHHAVLTTLGAGPFVAGHTHTVLDTLGVRRVPMAPGDTARVVWALRSGLVDTLLTTPSFGLHLASVLEAAAVEPDSLGLGHVVVGGEPGGGLGAVRRRLTVGLGAYVTEVAGLGEVAPSLFGECPAKQGMHFCGQDYVWLELVDGTGRPVALEAGAVGEAVYTTLGREAMPLVRFRSGDLLEVVGTSCECGRTGVRVRITGRTDDMFTVRGVNVYPSAIQDVVATFQPAVTGRIRVVLGGGPGTTVEAPVPVEAEIPGGGGVPAGLAGEIGRAIRERLLFTPAVTLIPMPDFGPPGYKTPLVERR